jgi:hypothetical protein
MPTARRDLQIRGSLFKRVEGSGGDGGTEAYWVLPDGSEVAYQAKFFTRSGDINWTQIDRSVDTALANHLRLSKYVIALPCDFTGRTGASVRGKTGWDHWDRHSEKWTKLARSRLRRTIKFEPWTADELQSRLTLPDAAGLREYWFGDLELSAEWFNRHLEAAVAALDERYHPEDHVNVTTQKLAEFITRHGRSRQELAKHFAEIRRNPLPHDFGKDLGTSPPATLIKAANHCLEALTSRAADVPRPPWEVWDIAGWKHSLADAITKVRQIRSWIQKTKDVDGSQGTIDRKGTDQVNYIVHQLNQLSAVLRELDTVLNSSYLAAESSRSALVVVGQAVESRTSSAYCRASDCGRRSRSTHFGPAA